jgi:DNA-binding SARP family transcriptional activator
MDEESARRTFKTLLAEVRSYLRAIDPNIEWIISDQDQLTFNPLAPIWLDTAIFELDAGTYSRSLSQAIKLYRSNFLDGFFLKDAPEFDEWVRSTRDHFRQLYLAALHQMANLYEADNQLEQAVACMHMLLAADPFSEEAYILLMRLYWLQGDRTQALRQYDRLCTVLSEAFSVQPSPQTQALYQEIAYSGRTQPLSGATSVASIPVFSGSIKPESSIPASPVVTKVPEEVPFIGCESALAWFREHLANPANNRRLLLLEGEAGSGKTRLLQEVQRLYCANWLILQGHCQEAERKHPYHLFAEALRQGLQNVDLTSLYLPTAWLSQLVLLVPDLFPGGEGVQGLSCLEPTLLGDALAALCNQLAQPQQPLLFVLEDLQWADEITLGLIHHLVHSARHGTVFVLASCRSMQDAHLATLCRSASRQDLLATLALLPFSSEEIEELVTYVLSDTQFDALLEHIMQGENPGHWCFERSEGNPFFALAWLNLLKGTSETNQHILPSHIPLEIEALVRSEIQLLSRNSRLLLEAGASVGASFSLSTTAGLLGFDALSTLSAVEELVEHLFIGEDARIDFYAFKHTTVREVVLSTMGRARRQLLQSSSAAIQPAFRIC